MQHDEEISEVYDEKVEGETISTEEHYFWLDRRLLMLPTGTLSKKAILLYLLYARSCNPKHMQCSFVSYTAAKHCVGLSHTAVDNAREELIKQGLIKLRPDIKCGYFKTVAVEVLDFPSFDSDAFTPSENIRSILKSQGVLFLPSSLLDKGELNRLNLLEIRILLLLYSLCRWEECLGIDFQLVHAWHHKVPKGIIAIKKNFGSGFHPSIKGKPCFQVVPHKKWKIHDKVLADYGEGIYRVLNSLVEKGLFVYAPVVIWRDPEDSDIAEVRREIFKGIVKFHSKTDKYKQKYRLAPLNDNESVVWILRPVYPAKNSDYDSYTKKRTEQRQQAIQLYIYQYQGEQD